MEVSMPSSSEQLTINGSTLSVTDCVRVSDQGQSVQLTEDIQVLNRINRAHQCVDDAVSEGRLIYGVTTLFGGLANNKVNHGQASELQKHLILAHHAGVGNDLSTEDVRAAMLIRANTIARGSSGVSTDLIHRYLTCLNQGFTPLVKELGSIGASGDLIPLSTIAGAILGLSKDYWALLDGERVNALEGLDRLELTPYMPKPKEGLALINGTSVMAGMGVRNLSQFNSLFNLNLTCHALCLQGLLGTGESFETFIHQEKPQVGQALVAKHMRSLLNGSQSLSESIQEHHELHPEDLIQDRYSLRCIPQFMGPIAEQVRTIEHQLTVEMNSTTDNPLVEPESGRFFHGGNFHGQYISSGMDQLRLGIALLSKHMDAQIALLMAPEFNRGLSACLMGNAEHGLNIGLKPLQIAANSIMPLLEDLGNSVADRFPTHAEQFNQNINSQGMCACYQTIESLKLWKQYLSITCIIATQAVDLRAKALKGAYNALEILSPNTQPLYCAVKSVLHRTPRADTPLIWNDDEQCLSEWISAIHADLEQPDSNIIKALRSETGLLN